MRGGLTLACWLTSSLEEALNTSLALSNVMWRGLRENARRVQDVRFDLLVVKLVVLWVVDDEQYGESAFLPVLKIVLIHRGREGSVRVIADVTLTRLGLNLDYPSGGFIALSVCFRQ